MKRTAFLPILIFISHLWAYEYEYDLPEESSACSLSMKIQLDPLSAGEIVGRATVILRLKNKSGNPLSGYGVAVNSTGGTFVCDSTGGNAEDDGRSCFTTGADGFARIRLISVPLNTAVKVKASCDCGDYQVFASGNLTMTQATVKKKKKSK